MSKRPMPVVARCTKCGREFVTLPKEWPAYDPYWPRGTPNRLCIQQTRPCNGEIERIDSASGQTASEEAARAALPEQEET